MFHRELSERRSRSEREKKIFTARRQPKFSTLRHLVTSSKYAGYLAKFTTGIKTAVFAATRLSRRCDVEGTQSSPLRSDDEVCKGFFSAFFTRRPLYEILLTVRYVRVRRRMPSCDRFRENRTKAELKVPWQLSKLKKACGGTSRLWIYFGWKVLAY